MHLLGGRSRAPRRSLARPATGWFLATAVFALWFLLDRCCGNWSSGLGVRVDTSGHVYDGALHSVQAHASEIAPVASHDGSEGAQETVAIATGHLSVLL